MFTRLPARRVREHEIAHHLAADSLNSANVPGPSPDRPADVRHGEGFTVWLTGMSGAGKTTIARALGRELSARDLQVQVLDGDAIRTSLCRDLGFDKHDRMAVAARVAFVAALLAKHGVCVIVAVISPYRESRELARRQHNTLFLEVFVDCPLAILRTRDTKGLYKKAESGAIDRFTGVSDPYEIPHAADLHLRTDRQTVTESVGVLMNHLRKTRAIPADA